MISYMIFYFHVHIKLKVWFKCACLAADELPMAMYIL